jgi:hypothetical protein
MTGIAGLDPTAFMTAQSGLREKEADIQEQIISAAQTMASQATMVSDARGYTPIMRYTELAGRMAAEEKNAAALQSLDYDALLADMAAESANLKRQAFQQAQKIREDQSVSLFTDPLQALINQFTLPWDRQALQGTIQSAKIADETINALNKQATETARTHDMTKQTLSIDAIASAVTASQAEINVKAEEYRVKSLAANANNVAHAMAANKEQLELWHKTTQEKRLEEDQEMRRKEHGRRMELLGLEHKDRAQKEKIWETQLSLVEMAVKDAGGVFNREHWEIRQNDPLFKEMMEIGLRLAQIKPGDKPTDGFDPIERQKKDKLFNRLPATQQEKRLKELEYDAIQEAIKLNNGKAPDPRKAEQIFQEKALALQKDIREGDDTNPFRGVTYGVIADQEFVKNHPLWNKYIAPTVGDRATQTISPEHIIGQLRQAMVNDGVSPTEAAEFGQLLFAASGVLNTNALQYEKRFNGLVQKHYIYKPDSHPLMGSMLRNSEIVGLVTGESFTPALGKNEHPTKFDLLDRTAWQNLMMREYVYGKFRGNRGFLQNYTDMRTGIK